MEIKRADFENLNDLKVILEQARIRLGCLGIDQWQNGYPDADTLAEDIRLRRCRLARSESGIAGFYVLSRSPETGYDQVDGTGWLTEDSEYLVIHRLAVSDQAVGSGVAKRMMQDAARQAGVLSIRSLRADTHRGNLPMQRLLVREGFAYCGLIDLGPDCLGDPIRMAYEKIVDVDEFIRRKLDIAED